MYLSSTNRFLKSIEYKEKKIKLLKNVWARRKQLPRNGLPEKVSNSAFFLVLFPNPVLYSTQ